MQQASQRQSGAARQASQQQAAPQELKLIKRATLRFRVDEYAEARAAIAERVRRSGGYVAAEEETRHPGRLQNAMTLRVPSERFDALLEALADLAVEVDGREVRVEDVTEEFVDAEARLRARRAVEARYLSLLEEARSVEDVLRVESELQEVREEIERVEGRLEYLQDRVALSTITARFYQDRDLPALAAAPGFFSRAADAFADGWAGLLQLVLLAINLWPLLLLIVLVGLALRAYRNRRGAAPSSISERAV